MDQRTSTKAQTLTPNGRFYFFLDFMWAGFGGPRASLANVAAVAAVLCDPERADQEKKNTNPSLLALTNALLVQK